MLELLTQIHREKPEEMNEMAVLSMATSNVFAGSDTTAISISAVLYYLCRFPECKEKVLKEIAEIRKDSEGGVTVLLAEANRMPYLQACINEALRLHPAVGMSLPRVVPVGGMEVDGRYIPAGVCLLSFLYSFASS
jgi:cytochrome P450